MIPSRVRATRAAHLGGAGVVLFVVGLYVYNSIRHNSSSLQGDQWFWVTNVLVPYDDGRISLFDAVTFEYQNFAHSHIPTLFVFLANYKWFGLTSTIDTVVGCLALVGVVGVVWRHCSELPSRGWAQFGLVTVSTVVFMSSGLGNFVWSLLQFQMLYIFVAFLYLYLFSRHIETSGLLLVAVAMPSAMVFGDAIGAAAVAASLIYVFVLVILRRFPWKLAAAYSVLFAIYLVVLGALLRGQRQHGGDSAFDFVENLISDPGVALRAYYYALAEGFVGLHDETSSLAFLRWDAAWLWFGIGCVILVGGAVGLRRVGLEHTDHFPLMLMIASLFWTLGVVRARGYFFGPTVLQQPRYAAYTTVFGIGAVLLLVSKAAVLGRLRHLAAAALVAVIAANSVGSLVVSLDDSGERVQDAQIAALRTYVEGDREEAPTLGLACSDWSPCLEAAWFLWDRHLGPFVDDPERSPWVLGYRKAVYGRFHSAGDQAKHALCAFISGASPADLEADIRSADGLAPLIDENNVEIPDSDLEAAADILARAMATKCLSFQLQAQALPPNETN